MARPERFRSLFDGLAYYIAAAIVLLVTALLGFLAVRLSTDDMLLWTGTRVVGSEQRGIVFYDWNHRQYTLDATGYGTKPRVTVYLNPADPGHAVTDSLGTRVLDAFLTVVPLALGFLTVIVGVVRRRTFRRNATAYSGGYGRGLDPAVVDRLLSEARNRPR